MRGKTLLIILFSLVLVCLTGCVVREYPFKEPIDEIESIEIVWAENSLEFTVIKTLSEEENFRKKKRAILLRNFKQSNFIVILSEIQCRLTGIP